MIVMLCPKGGKDKDMRITIVIIINNNNSLGVDGSKQGGVDKH